MAGKQDLAQENYDSAYFPLITGANKVLDTLASVWKYSIIALLLSLSIIGAISIGLYVVIGLQTLFVEGIIFLGIAAWIFIRNLTSNCNRCCNADIPRWKRVLGSFVQPDHTVTSADGQSVTESLIHVIDESEDWIRLIRRDVFSVLFWPVIAAVIFVLTAYTVDFAVVRVVEVLFIIYVFILTGAIYYTVKIKFQSWQDKVSHFKGHAASALENL